MKTLYKYILAIVAVLAFVPMASAQYVEQNGIALNKSVSGPKNGQYTITLEAFTTGTVTVTDGVAPADIVLVLDYSNSMTMWGRQYLANLKKATAKFVQIVKDSNDGVVADDNGKHRIAVVIYNGSVIEENYLNKFLAVEQLTTGASNVYYNQIDIIGRDSSSGTLSGAAMQRASNVIKGEADLNHYTDSETHQNSKRSKIVVFFTDGQPGVAGAGSSSANSEVNQGTLCITSANVIKNTFGGTVYSVGLFDSTSASRASTFLKWVSSDYNNKTSYPANNSSVWETVSDVYSFLVTDDEKLEDIFGSIADSASSSGANLGESSTVTVDVLSASFTLPENADKDNIKTYTAKCNGAKKGTDGKYITFTENGVEKIKEFTFDDPVATAGSELFSGVEVDDSEFDNDIISVKGFDYEEYFCAIEKENGEYTDNAVGYKLVIEIPIIINPESVGGPNTATNDPKSGVYLTDDEGNRYPTPALTFNQPTLPVPVNLVVRKLGLNKGESAKFVIQRTSAYDSSNKLIPVSQATWSTFESSATWTPLTTFVLTGDGSEYVEFSITGLSDRYYYRILEEDGTMVKNSNWSWSYTGSALTYTNSYQQLKNPFIFNNSKGETTRKHAESVVTNVFQAGVDPVTVDSREFFKDSNSGTAKQR